MNVFNKMHAPMAVVLSLLLCSSPVLDARNKKPDKLLKEARSAEERQDWDQALDLYEQAMRMVPGEPTYQIGVRRVRFEAGQAHVDKGRKLREQGQLEPALVEFDKAFAIDASSSIALQEIRRTSDMMERVKKGMVKPGDVGLTPVEVSRKETEERIGSMSQVPTLKPITNTIKALKMNNQPPRVLYETVGKLAGVNVIFDPALAPTTKSNLDLTDATLEQALDYIALLTKTFWKPLTANTIFVAEDNPTKRRDYEDEVVKVFYLKNVTSTQELQEIVQAVRSVTDIRRMFVYTAQNAVVARDTVDKIALAEKLFHDMDKAKAEVIVDIVVLEVNKDHTRNLAAGLTSGTQTGLVLPIGFAPTNALLSSSGGSTTTGTTTGTVTGTTTGTDTGTTTGTTTTGTTTGSYIGLGSIGRVGLNDFSISLPGALLQAVLSDNLTRVLQSPQVRASDGQKVSLKIGEKVPYATGSFNTGSVGVSGTSGISPLVSTQFNFYDVGVNVDLTPHVHGNDEITLDVVIEISNVANTVNVGGLDEPEIAQRKNDAHIRVRDGEVNLLGGLMQIQNTDSSSGVPGLYNVPVLGKLLLGSNNIDRSREELMIALIPHIVRTPNISDIDMRGVAAGTDQNVRVTYDHKEEPAPATAAPVPTAPMPSTPAAPTSNLPSGAAAGPLTLAFTPGSVQSGLSAPVLVNLEVSNATDLFAAPVHVKWDPKILRLNSVTPGILLTQDSQKMNPPSIDIRNDAGEASVNISRLTGAGGVSGSGSLAMFSFTAVGKGQTAVSVVNAALVDSKQQPMNAGAPQVQVTVQ